MGYAEYLKDTLRPLHIYELESGIGADELEAEGAAMDEVFDRLISCEADMLPQTASAEGLDMLEELLPFKPSAASIEERRNAVAALLSLDGQCSLAAINRSLAGCGAAASASESDTPEQVVVKTSASEGLGELKKRIEQIIPCHLEIIYGT